MFIDNNYEKRETKRYSKHIDLKKLTSLKNASSISWTSILMIPVKSSLRTPPQLQTLLELWVAGKGEFSG